MRGSIVQLTRGEGGEEEGGEGRGARGAARGRVVPAAARGEEKGSLPAVRAIADGDRDDTAQAHRSTWRWPRREEEQPADLTAERRCGRHHSQATA